jgi:predicted signal transduction protein with EAL and GGDEF domain
VLLGLTVAAAWAAASADRAVREVQHLSAQRGAWEELKALGCDTAQGYHLGRPMPAADLERWLRQAVPDGSAQPHA